MSSYGNIFDFCIGYLLVTRLWDIIENVQPLNQYCSYLPGEVKSESNIFWVSEKPWKWQHQQWMMNLLWGAVHICHMLNIPRTCQFLVTSVAIQHKMLVEWNFILKIKHEMSQVDGKPPWLKLYMKKKIFINITPLKVLVIT